MVTLEHTVTIVRKFLFKNIISSCWFITDESFSFQTNVKKKNIFPWAKKKLSFSDLIFSYDNSLTSIISIKLVKKDIMDVTVLLTAPEIVKHVDTLTASALVRRGGLALIVLKVYTNVKRDWRLNVMKKQAICTNAPY